MLSSKMTELLNTRNRTQFTARMMKMDAVAEEDEEEESDSDDSYY